MASAGSGKEVRMHVAEILSAKGREVATITAERKLSEAVDELAAKRRWSSKVEIATVQRITVARVSTPQGQTYYR